MAWTAPALVFHLPPSSLLTLNPKSTVVVVVSQSFFSNPKPSSSSSSTSLPHNRRLSPSSLNQSIIKPHICSAAEYKFPDPIPEFAVAETDKFRAHLLQKLSKKQHIYGDSVQQVVDICTDIFNTFMHTEYGGPGTLMVLPFIDMSDTLNERGLPGGPQAARAAVKWAQDHVDKHWNQWTGDDDDDDDDNHDHDAT